MTNTRVLTQAEMDLAYSRAIDGFSLRNIAIELGFNDNMQFHRYCMKYPDFNKLLQDARIASGSHREDEIFNLADVETDPQRMRARLECLKTGMQFLNPQKYSPKFEMNVNQTIDLTAVISAATQRIVGEVIDIPQITNDFNKLIE